MTERQRAVAAESAAPLATFGIIASGLALQAGPHAIWGREIWSWGLVLLGGLVVGRTVLGALRGRWAADLVAALAIVAAILLHHPLPGLVVVLMQTGGEALERYAAGRASRAVQALEAAAPHRALRVRDGAVEEIAADAVAVGDELLIRPGEMVPVDAEVIGGNSHVDASRLTGEPVPVPARPGIHLLSGSLNLESPVSVRALALAGESQYARIVQLVRTAQGSKSPLQRMADRYAVLFTPLTLLVCLLAWLWSRDPVRVLAVLVVATPCPLILAAPVAMIGGINRAARRSIIVRHGEALERLGQATAALLDKTGTLTIGRPDLATLHPVPPYTEDELLRLAAAVEQGSGHSLAQSVIGAATRRGVTPVVAQDVVEAPGQGVTGVVNGHEVTLGSRVFVTHRHPDLAASWVDGSPALRAWLAVDGKPAGTLEFADRVRPEAATLVAGLRSLGLRRVILVTGDHPAHAEAVASAVGLEEIRSQQLPGDKVAVVEELERSGERVLMVGDGTNDAPALTRASVGVALAAHGGGITAEAADVVVLADDPSRVVEAVTISRRTLRIARQSIWAGLGLSGVAMAAAALGLVPPTAGALLQELIDVAVILNALRASQSPALEATGA